MLNPKDAYHYFEQVPITSGTAEIGILYADYEVIHYTNVQNLTSTRSYVITCKQRFIGVIPRISFPHCIRGHSLSCVMLRSTSISSVPDSNRLWME